jgi:hypothetical protein
MATLVLRQMPVLVIILVGMVDEAEDVGNVDSE